MTLSCNNSSEQEKQKSKKIAAHDCDHDKPHKHEKKEAHFEKRSKLKLNEGEKWVLNEATGIGMSKIKELCSNFNRADAGKEDYLRLSESISEQTDYIIKECDMTGEGHNQLHVLLNDFLPKIKKLGKVETGEDGEALLEQISADIDTYFEYFKSE